MSRDLRDATAFALGDDLDELLEHLTSGRRRSSTPAPTLKGSPGQQRRRRPHFGHALTIDTAAQMYQNG